MHRTNGDLRYNLLEAAHKRRSLLRRSYLWVEDKTDYYAKVERLERWVKYRLAKLTHA